jgi:oligosaccharide repeat unit polymerase
MLFILFSSWNSYSNIKGFDFSDINEKKLAKVERVVIWINAFVFIVDLIVFIAVFALLVAGVVHVNEYKNGGDSDLRQSVFATIMPSIFITISYLLSSFGYLSLTLHFYYIVKRNAKKSILHLILSLTIVLVGIIGLSRSALVNYVIIYVIMFLFVMPLLNKRVFKKTFIAILIFGSAIGYVFSAISEDRFGESFYIESKSLIDEKEYPKLVSILDYFSQWEYFGPILMERYSGPSDLSWGMFNNNGIGVAILQRIYGSDNYNQASRKRIEKVIGDTSSAFHGCIVRTIFDFGYTGTFLFVLLNCFFTKKWGPNKKKLISFKTLLTMPLILPFSIGFFSGSSYGQFFLNLGMIYMWLIYKYCKQTVRKQALIAISSSVN